MSSTKRISGNYTIATVNPNDTVNINTSLVTINGNLIVTGNSQQIVSTDSAITNNIITLNHGVTTPNPFGAAIEVDRGGGGYANVQLRWNETLHVWQLTNDGTNYANIGTIYGSGVSLTSVSGDTNPALGGNLNIGTYTLYSSTSNFHANAGTVAGGGSGMYVSNNNYQNAELATKTRSIAYSIIFG